MLAAGLQIDTEDDIELAFRQCAPAMSDFWCDEILQGSVLIMWALFQEFNEDGSKHPRLLCQLTHELLTIYNQHIPCRQTAVYEINLTRELRYTHRGISLLLSDFLALARHAHPDADARFRTMLKIPHLNFKSEQPALHFLYGLCLAKYIEELKHEFPDAAAEYFSHETPAVDLALLHDESEDEQGISPEGITLNI